jgi:hypothetical protein
MAISALALFAACGDDDDDDTGGDRDSSENDDQTEEPSDEDEDEDDDDNGGGGGSGDEREYVAHVCQSLSDFVDEVIAAGSENPDATEEEQLEILREPFANLTDALDDADPPGDIEEYHDRLVDGFQEVRERIEDGDVTALEGDPLADIPEPPADIQEKYNAIAEDVSECAATGLFE